MYEGPFSDVLLLSRKGSANCVDHSVCTGYVCCGWAWQAAASVMVQETLPDSIKCSSFSDKPQCHPEMFQLPAPRCHSIPSITYSGHIMRLTHTHQPPRYHTSARTSQRECIIIGWVSYGCSFQWRKTSGIEESNSNLKVTALCSRSLIGKIALSSEQSLSDSELWLFWLWCLLMQVTHMHEHTHAQTSKFTARLAFVIVTFAFAKMALPNP